MEWMISLHYDNASELRSFDWFMITPCKLFEDPFTQCKVQAHIKTINQGLRGMAAYNHEFCELACQLADCPEDILIECFQDRLKDDVYNTCISRGPPGTLYQWYLLAEEMETDMARSCNCNAPGWCCFFPLEKKDALKTPGCNPTPNSDPQAASNVVRKDTTLLTDDSPKQLQNLAAEKKVERLTPRPRKMELKGVKVIEFSLPSYRDQGTLTTPERGNTDSDYDPW